MKNKIVGLFTLGAAVLGMSMVSLPAQAAVMQPKMNVCKTVKVPKSLPWYQCVNFTPGLNVLPYGCYVHYKTVCSR